MGIGTAALPDPWGAQQRRGATAGLDKIRHQDRQQPGFSGSRNTWAIQGHFEDVDAAVVFYPVKYFVKNDASNTTTWNLRQDMVKKDPL